MSDKGVKKLVRAEVKNFQKSLKKKIKVEPFFQKK
jgi:hypothetical protein